MERSVLVRRTAPVAVFLAVLAGLVALAARDGGDGDARGSRKLSALPLSASGGGRTAGAAEGAPRAADSKSMYYGGEIVIPDSLLTGLPTEGPAYKVGGTPATDRIEALARALGISGSVRTDEQGWVVGEGDVVLRVMKYAGLPWYLGPDKVAVRDVGVATAAPATAEPGSAEPGSTEPGTAEPATPEPAPKPTSDPDEPVSTDPGCTTTPDGVTACTKPPDCPKPPDGAEPTCVEPVPPTPMPEPTKPPQPTDAQARATAQKVFDALGISGATITVNDAWSGLEVVAAPVVGGLPTVGWETRVTVEVGPKVQYANGFLSTATLENDYPLLAPREAVERGGSWGPRLLGEPVGAPCATDQPCPTPAPREATKVRLGLLFMAGYDETQAAYLAPAWLLTFEGSTYEEPFLALPDQYIATPPPATDQPDKGDGATVDPSSGSGSSGGGAPGSTGAPE